MIDVSSSHYTYWITIQFKINRKSLIGRIINMFGVQKHVPTEFCIGCRKENAIIK